MSKPSTRKFVTTTIACFSGAALLMLGACSSGSGTSHKDFTSNPTPELHSLARRHSDNANTLTITNDTNLRAMVDDINRVLLLERPSRLTKGPIGW